MRRVASLIRQRECEHQRTVRFRLLLRVGCSLAVLFFAYLVWRYANPPQIVDVLVVSDQGKPVAGVPVFVHRGSRLAFQRVLFPPVVTRTDVTGKARVNRPRPLVGTERNDKTYSLAVVPPPGWAILKVDGRLMTDQRIVIRLATAGRE